MKDVDVAADRSNLTWRITDRLGGAIVGGSYPPGTVLPREDEISAQHGVGRSAVREAVKVLEAKGLIEVRPRRGTSVLPFCRWNLYDRDIQLWMRSTTTPSRTLLRELLEARTAFEPMAAGLAARRGSSAAIEQIGKAYRRMEAAARGEDDPYDADLGFHTAILDAAGNRYFAGLAPLIGTALVFSFRTTNAARGDAVGDLAAHRSLLEAIERRDPRAAEAAMHSLLGDVGRVLDTLPTSTSNQG